MTYLAIAVALVGALGLVNLLLGLAIIARLREHSEKLGQLDDLPKPALLGNGKPVPEFAARTVDGDELTRADLTEGSLVAFFSPGCSSCVEQVPDFVARTASWPAGRVVAVVVADASQSTDALVRDLAASAQVVLEEHGGAVGAAFKLTGVPAMCRMGPDGTIAASGANLDDVLGTSSGAPSGARETVLVRLPA